jgi:ribosomal protein L11 methyltransferase
LGKTWPALEIYAPGCDPQLQELILAELDDFHPTAIQESDEPSPLRAFFSSTAARDAAAQALGVAFRHHLFVTTVDVPDEDWAERSQAQLRAITIGRLVIAPPWDTYEKQGQTPFLVRIKPSMGFGTGHHATTRLMLKTFQALPVRDRAMLDIGCGSGILAIAAVLLGARSAVGVDIDADALANAAENVQLNNLTGRVGLEHRDLGDLATPADIVAANLTGELLTRSAKRLADLVTPQGYLVVSGFMESERGSVVTSLEKFLTLQNIDHEDEWLCAMFRRQP